MFGNNMADLYNQLKFVVGKVVLFGVTWTISALPYGPKLDPVFQTIGVLLNSCQGLFIFLFVLLDKRFEVFRCCVRDQGENDVEDAENPMDPVSSGQDRHDDEEDLEHESLMIQETVIDKPNEGIRKR